MKCKYSCAVLQFLDQWGFWDTYTQLSLRPYSIPTALMTEFRPYRFRIRSISW